MSYESANFQTVVGANTDSGGLHLYRNTADTLATMKASGYFTDKTLSLEVGDRILLEASDGSQTVRVTASGKAAGDPTTAATVAAASAPSGVGAKVFLSRHFTDIGAASSVYMQVPAGCSGDVTRITFTADAAIATADAVLTGYIGAVAITGGVVTVPVASAAAGQVASATPTAARTVVGGTSVLRLASDGGPSATVSGTVVWEITLA